MIRVRIIALLLLPIAHLAIADSDEAAVQEIVKKASCLAQQTIEETLNNKIHTGSQRDLGWLVFKENDLYEVERAFLMNKSMQLRFRWRVNADNSITPLSKRAQSLCTDTDEAH